MTLPGKAAVETVGTLRSFQSFFQVYYFFSKAESSPALHPSVSYARDSFGALTALTAGTQTFPLPRKASKQRGGCLGTCRDTHTSSNRFQDQHSESWSPTPAGHSRTRKFPRNLF